MIPDRFTGGWKRRSIRLGDGQPHEGSTVIWLQAGERFADLRLPRAEDTITADPSHPVMSFAGWTSWDPSSQRLRWHHTLDLDAWPAEDGGEVRFDGEDLIETGTFEIDGAEVAYTEIWERLPESDKGYLVLETGGAMLVQVGTHCLVIADRRGDDGGTFDATYREWSHGEWATRLSYGTDPHGLPVPPSPPPIGTTVTLSDRPWTVVERRD